MKLETKRYNNEKEYVLEIEDIPFLYLPYLLSNADEFEGGVLYLNKENEDEYITKNITNFTTATLLGAIDIGVKDDEKLLVGSRTGKPEDKLTLMELAEEAIGMMVLDELFTNGYLQLDDSKLAPIYNLNYCYIDINPPLFDEVLYDNNIDVKFTGDFENPDKDGVLIVNCKVKRKDKEKFEELLQHHVRRMRFKGILFNEEEFEK